MPRDRHPQDGPIWFSPALLVRQLRHHLDRVSRILSGMRPYARLCHTPYAVPVLIGCRYTLAIRCCTANPCLLAGTGSSDQATPRPSAAQTANSATRGPVVVSVLPTSCRRVAAAWLPVSRFGLCVCVCPPSTPPRRTWHAACWPAPLLLISARHAVPIFGDSGLTATVASVRARAFTNGHAYAIGFGGGGGFLGGFRCRGSL